MLRWLDIPHTGKTRESQYCFETISVVHPHPRALYVVTAVYVTI